MKASELRTGNIVCIYQPGEYHGYRCTICAVNELTGNCTVYIARQTYLDVHCNDLGPVELTDKTLALSHFSRQGIRKPWFRNTAASQEEPFILLEGEDYDGPKYEVIEFKPGHFVAAYHCKYIHEVQNIFAGVDGEIKPMYYDEEYDEDFDINKYHKQFELWQQNSRSVKKLE